MSTISVCDDCWIVSRSTDSELKSWHTDSGVCIRTYRGHTNDKNFVGLTVTPDFIACGALYFPVLLCIGVLLFNIQAVRIMLYMCTPNK